MTGIGISRWKPSGLRENSGQDGGIEEPYWGPSANSNHLNFFQDVRDLKQLTMTAQWTPATCGED